MTRLERLRALLEEPLLVTKAINVRYLCGLRSSNAALLVQPDGPTRLYTDFRYREKARAVEGVELVETKRSLVKDLAELLSGTVGFEAAHVSYDSYRTLAEGGAELVPRVGLVEGLRAVKDEDEIGAIRRAAELADEGFRQLAASPFVGRTEPDLAWQLEKSFRELGAEASSFEAIVAAGPNGALPHANPGERIVERGQLVVVDAGCMVDGYCSDCTRTYSTGGLSDELAGIYETCLAAQLASLEAVRPGADGVAVDAVARDAIAGRRLRRGVRARARARRRARDPRDADALDPLHRHARGGQRRHRRAGDLPARRRRRPHRGPRRRARGRAGGADPPPEGAHEVG